MQHSGVAGCCDEIGDGSVAAIPSEAPVTMYRRWPPSLYLTAAPAGPSSPHPDRPLPGRRSSQRRPIPLNPLVASVRLHTWTPRARTATAS